MKDILQDLVSHTHNLGFITTLKVTAETNTVVESMADDRSVIMTAVTHTTLLESLLAHLVCQIWANLLIT